MRAHVQLDPQAIIAAPAELPAWLDGLGASEEQILDWGWAGHVGEGSWPIVETREPFDPETEAETGPVASIDAAARTVTHVYGKRALTAEEIEARRPPRQPISAMQLAVALMLSGKITAPEARAFGRAGVLPPSIEPAIVAALTAAGLDATAREIALLQLESATEYHRNHQVTPIIGAALNMDSAALDALWDTASQIL